MEKLEVGEHVERNNHNLDFIGVILNTEQRIKYKLNKEQNYKNRQQK